MVESIEGCRLVPIFEKALVEHQIGIQCIRRVFQHISKRDLRWPLFRNLTVKGEFYEALIYEAILELAPALESLTSIVAKGPDVPQSNRTWNSSNGQDGLFYNGKGNILICGDGTSLGEFDIVLFDKSNHIIYCEVKSSGKFLYGFEKDVRYKKRLLEILLGQKIHFWLISAHDISRYEELEPLWNYPENGFARIKMPPPNIIKSALQSEMVNDTLTRTEGSSGRLCEWNTLDTKIKLNYAESHKTLRENVISLVRTGESRDSIVEEIETSIVKRIFLGKLSARSVEYFLQFNEVTVEGVRISPSVFKRDFTNIVLALSVPRLRPMFYFERNSRKEYLKIVAETGSMFKVEEMVNASYNFFKYLKRADQVIESTIFQGILQSLVTPEIYGLERKDTGRRWVG